MMKKKYLIWSLGLLPAFGGFVGPYLAGRNLVSWGTGDIMIGFLSVLLLPLVTVPIIAVVTATRWWVRVALLLPILVFEAAVFYLVGPQAKAHTLGVAHRLTQNISSVDIQGAATEIASKRLNGTIKTTNMVLRVHGVDVLRDYNLFVDKSELPRQLQDKFTFVAFRNESDLVFAVNLKEGFYWTSNKDYVTGYDSYPLGNGVWVFCYQRE